ncbi:MAG: hypothetical protein E7458_09195 [Ruminococcaceae bacterium]|nr:hypothetical protein [Oscillospiraceae bacterium]
MLFLWLFGLRLRFLCFLFLFFFLFGFFCRFLLFFFRVFLLFPTGIHHSDPQPADAQPHPQNAARILRSHAIAQPL